MAAAAEAALRPVHDDLLRDAHAEADRIVVDAERDAARAVAAADETGRAILAEARALGSADGQRAARDILMQAHRGARYARLAAERTAFEQLQSACVRAAEGLRRDARYPGWLDTLRATAHRRLGDEARIEEAPGGGITGVVPGRFVDLRFETLALESLAGPNKSATPGKEVSGAWTP